MRLKSFPVLSCKTETKEKIIRRPAEWREWRKSNLSRRFGAMRRIPFWQLFKKINDLR